MKNNKILLLLSLVILSGCGGTTTSNNPSSNIVPNTTTNQTTTIAPTTTAPVDKNELTIKENFDVMSFNILNSGDTTAWKNRFAAIVDYIEPMDMDIIGFQEVRFIQYRSFYNELGDKYNFVYFPRESGSNPEGSMIAFKKSFQLVEKDMFWLSDTPDKYAKGYDPNYYRICASVLLKSEKGTYINVYDAHLGLGDDDLGIDADDVRTKEATVMLNRMSDKYPTIALGDFNAFEDSNCYKKLTVTMTDSQKVAPVTENGKTYHNYGKSTHTTPIDYIFVKNGITPKVFDIKTDRYNNDSSWYSDHYPITANLDIEYKVDILNDVKSIEFDGEVTVTNNQGMTEIDNKVIATLNDGSKKTLNEDEYILEIPDDFQLGKENKVVAKLYGREEISATKTAKVTNRYQAELASFVGGSINTQALNYVKDSKLITNESLYTFVGAFNGAVRAGNEGSVTFKINSEGNIKGDLVLNLGNSYYIKEGSLYYMGEVALNKVAKVLVNNKAIDIPNTVKFEKSIGNSSHSPLWNLQHNLKLEDVTLLKGVNVIKFELINCTEILDNGGNSLATTNFDSIDFITNEYNLSVDMTIESLEINEATIVEGNNLTDIEVYANLTSGYKKILDPSQYSIKIEGNESETKIILGKYNIIVTLLENPSITLIKSINLINYTSIAKKVDLYIENNRVIYEMTFINSGYAPEDYYFFWSAQNHVYETTSTQTENEIIFKIDATDLPRPSSNIAICPHVKLTKDGVQSMYENGKNSNGDILAKDSSGNLIFEIKDVTLNNKKYSLINKWDMPLLQITDL